MVNILESVKKSKEGKIVNYVLFREIKGEGIVVGSIRDDKIDYGVRETLEYLLVK